MKQFYLLLFLVLCRAPYLHAQTDLDADMMAKHLLCTGPMYSYSSFDHYWEGIKERDNLNMGTVSTKTISWMGNYGISKRLNILFNVPYVITKASAGTMHGMKGFQDLSLFVKWLALKKQLGGVKISLIGVGGFSLPLTAYNADFLPLSIGVGSKNVTFRAIADMQHEHFFTTVSGSYVYRNNIALNRSAYYTTEMHLTNKVQMPDVAYVNLRTGFRSKRLVVEALCSNMTTLGGFDITRNNMPFPSNRMNATMVGAETRFVPKAIRALTLMAEINYTVAGRNTGQSLMAGAGVNYIFSFSGKTPPVTPPLQ